MEAGPLELLIILVSGISSGVPEGQVPHCLPAQSPYTCSPGVVRTCQGECMGKSFLIVETERQVLQGLFGSLVQDC